MSPTLGAKFSDEVAEKVTSFCNLRGETVSTFLRRIAITELARYSFFDDEVKKATGVEIDE